MSARKISDLPAAATPLTGAELIPGVQTGASVQLNACDLASYVAAASHTWAQTQTFTVPPAFTDAPGTRATLGLGSMATQAANAVAVTGGSAAGLTGFGIRSTGTGGFDLEIKNTENLGANRALIVTLNNADRSIKLAGNLQLASDFQTSGAFGLVLSVTAATNVTLPTTGTLATRAGTETLQNKSIDGAQNTLTNVRVAEGLRNFDKRNYMRLRAALAKVQTKTGQAKIACVGDSTTAGYGAGVAGANHTGGARPKAYPAMLAKYLTGLGLPAAAQSFWGWAGLATTTDLNDYDPRLSVSSSWSAPPFTSLGGALLRGDNTGTGTLSFTPSEAVDTFDIYYVKGTGNGAFNANIDGGFNTLTDENNASAALAKLTLTAASVGTHTLNLARASGGNVYIIGVHAYDSTTPKLHLLNMGWGGSTSANWNDASQAWSPKVALATVAPDAIFLMLGANDMHAGTVDATFNANVAALISTWAAIPADIVLVNFPPCASTWPVAPATRALYLAKLQALADANNLALLDLDYLQKDYTTANGLGLFDTGIHPSALGYADIAREFATMTMLF